MGLRLHEQLRLKRLVRYAFAMAVVVVAVPALVFILYLVDLMLVSVGIHID